MFGMVIEQNSAAVAVFYKVPESAWSDPNGDMPFEVCPDEPVGDIPLIGSEE